MSRSFKKHVFGLSVLADWPYKQLKRVAVKKVRKYKFFEVVSNGGWYKKVFDSDRINGWISWRVFFTKNVIKRNYELYRELKRK
jgi:hypothetical protein